MLPKGTNDSVYKIREVDIMVVIVHNDKYEDNHV